MHRAPGPLLRIGQARRGTSLHLAHTAQGFPSINARHGQVHEDGVGPEARGQQVQGIVAAGGLAHREAQGFQQLHQQLAVGLLVVHHQDAASLPGVPGARTRLPCLDSRRGRQGFAQHVGMHLRQEQLDVEHRARAGRAADRQLAPHQGREHLGNRQPQAGARRRSTASAAAREGLEDALDLCGRETRPGVLHLDACHLARIAHAQRDGALRGELDGIAQQVDEDLAQALFIGPHHLGDHALHVELKGQAFGGRLQLEQAGDLVQAIGKPHGCDVEGELAGFDARDVQRALDEREQMLAAAADHVHSLLAVGGNLGVLAHQLRVAQDGVERRANLVADGADVAALGLVGLLGRLLRLLGHAARGLQGLVGLAVQFDLAHQQARLAVRLLLRHLTALVRQHQPPRNDARDDQQRQVGLEQARAQRDLRGRHHLGVGHGLREGVQLLVVEQPHHGGQQRRNHQHQQQEVAQARVQGAPYGTWQQPAQCGRPLHRHAGVGLAQVAAARIQRAAQRANGAPVRRALGHVGCLVFALAHHAALHHPALVAAPIGRPRAGHGARHGHGHGRTLACDVVLAPRRPGNEWRRHKGHGHRNHGRECLR